MEKPRLLFSEGYYGTALKACGGADGDSPHVQLLKGIALNLYGQSLRLLKLYFDALASVRAQLWRSQQMAAFACAQID